MDQPLISVIVPAYNAQKSIETCCKTVFQQTYPNWELIVVDDGSTDGTLRLLERLAAERTNMTVIHTENRGVCAARNLGMDTAKGDYISFLDADDGLTEMALEDLYQRIKVENCDIVIGNMGTLGDTIYWQEKDALIKSLEDHPAGYAVWGKLYKKNAVSDVRFIEGKKIHEDTFFVFQCFLRKPKVVGLSEQVIIRNVYEFVHRESASTADFSEKFLDILYFAEEKKRLIEEYYPELSCLTENMLLKANMALLRNLCKTYDPKWRKLEKQCLRTVWEKKGSFIPAIPADEKWIKILVNGLYPVYKLRFYMKRKLKKLWTMIRNN